MVSNIHSPSGSRLQYLDNIRSLIIYLIHMVPQVVLQLLALSWPVSSLLKFIGVSLLTLLLSYLLSRFLVRKSTSATILGLVLLFIAMCLFFR